MTMHTVIKGETPTLKTYPPVLGQATSAKYRIASPAVGLPSEDDWTTVDAGDLPTESETLNVKTDRGNTSLLFLSAPAADVGEFLFVDLSGSWSFTVEVAARGATSVASSVGVPTLLGEGTAVKNFRIPVTLTAAQTATLGMRGLVKMSAVVGGETYEWDEHFEVVDETMATPLTVGELQSYWPDVRRYVSSKDFTLTLFIEAAWELIAYPELQARGVRSHLINNVAPLKPVMMAACRQLAYQNKNPEDTAGIEAKREAMLHALSLAMAGPDWYVAESDLEDVSADVGTTEPFARIRRVY